jgi:hypothetical protein
MGDTRRYSPKDEPVSFEARKVKFERFGEDIFVSEL